MGKEETIIYSNKDDVVLWIIIGFCLLTPVILASLWAFADRFYPPMLIAILLGIAIAALTYRYLGGPGEAEFSMGILKVAGSAALLLGTAYLANDGLSQQMDAANSANKLAAAVTEKMKAIKEREELAHRLEDVQRQLEIEQKQSTEILISEIAKLTPSSPLGEALVEMVQKRKGPFVEVTKSVDVVVTIVGYIKEKGQFNACGSLDLANEQVRFAREFHIHDEDEIKSVIARQVGVIENAICQKTARRFDVQMSCQDGALLFPDHVERCASDGSVKWRTTNGNRTFQLTAEVLNI